MTGGADYYFTIVWNAKTIFNIHDRCEKKKKSLHIILFNYQFFKPENQCYLYKTKIIITNRGAKRPGYGTAVNGRQPDPHLH